MYRIGIYFRAKTKIGRNFEKNLKIILRDNFRSPEIFSTFATVVLWKRFDRGFPGEEHFDKQPFWFVRVCFINCVKLWKYIWGRWASSMK